MCIRHAWNDVGGSMSDETIDAVLAGLDGMESITTVNLSGFGEAMEHRRFWDVLAELKAIGKSVEVISNGVWPDEGVAQRLIDSKLDRIIVSIDGINDRDDTPLHPGSFATVADNLKRLHQLRTAQRLDYPQIGIEFVATRQNIGELADLKKMSWVLGFSTILVTNVIPHTPDLAAQTLYEDWSTTSRALAPSIWSVHVDMPVMDPRAEVGGSIRRLSKSGAKVTMNGAEIVGASARCRFVTEGRMAVRWDGKVSPCLSLMHEHTYYHQGREKHMLPYHLGDVNAAPLADIWNSPEYVDFRDRVRNFEFSPCLDCGDCDLRETNEEDCYSDQFPRCGECLWAHGMIQCP